MVSPGSMWGVNGASSISGGSGEVKGCAVIDFHAATINLSRSIILKSHDK